MTIRGGETGMTLVEMLVVLAIVGIAAGAVVLGLGVGARGPSVEAEARRLADRLQRAADVAMVDDRPLAFAWDAKGYGFVGLDGRGGTGDAFARHRLPGGVALAVAGRSPILIGPEGSPVAARLDGGGGHWAVVHDGLTARAMPVPAS